MKKTRMDRLKILMAKVHFINSGREEPDITSQLLKMEMSHVFVTRKIPLSLLYSDKYPCCTSVSFLSPMPFVKFKKIASHLSLIFYVTC